jgi:hypothetical protein
MRVNMNKSELQKISDAEYRTEIIPRLHKIN